VSVMDELLDLSSGGHDWSGGAVRTLSLCLRASAWGVGFRRSTARTCWVIVSISFDVSDCVVPLIISGGARVHEHQTRGYF
jgi:hypothetical protein